MKSWAFAAMFVTVGVFAACSTKSITPTGGTCGDGVCDANEDSLLCPADCGSSSSSTSSGTSTSSSTSSGTSTSSSTSSGTSTSSSTSSGSSTSSSGSSSGGTCAAPQTTADCGNCATKLECIPASGAGCCDTANTTGATSYGTLIVNDAVCEVGGACLSSCNGSTDICADPTKNNVSMGCLTCFQALTNTDPGIVKFLADCKADANCLDFGSCLSTCDALP